MSERLVWNVPTANLDVLAISQQDFTDGLTAGTYQDPGVERGEELVDGKGLSAPPLVLAVDGRASEPFTFDCVVTGGHPDHERITYLFSDGQQSQSALPASLDGEHTFAAAGTYTVQAINDFGQRSNPVALSAPHNVTLQSPPEPAPQQQATQQAAPQDGGACDE